MRTNMKKWITILMIFSYAFITVPSGNSEEALLSREESSAFLHFGKEYIFDVDVAETGDYALLADYSATLPGIQRLTISVEVNGICQDKTHEAVTLPGYWVDDTQNYSINEFGSELLPVPVLLPERQQEYLRERVYCPDKPLMFRLDAGKNRICVRIVESDAEFYNLTAQTYSEPIEIDRLSSPEPSPEKDRDTEVMIIEGEKYSFKSSSSIRPGRSRSTQLHPFDVYGAKINSLAAATWKKPGDQVGYRFEIKEDGFYYLGLRYQQNEKADMNVFKTIRIDGKTPDPSMKAFAFSYTGSDTEETLIGTDGTPIPFYLEKGEHILTLTSTAEPIAEVHKMLKQIVTDMNDLALDIRLISGNKVDKDRKWELEYYLPDARERLTAMYHNIDEVYSLLAGSGAGTSESFLSTLSEARRQIGKFLEEKDGMDDLVNQLSSFAQSSGSLAESISLMTSDMLDQPLMIDRLYWLTDPDRLPDDNMSFFSEAWNEIRKTIVSFSLGSDTAQTTRKDKLNVWLIGSAQELEVLRELVEKQYPDGNVHVCVANESKIQLAIASDNAPDVVLGGTVNQTYQLGVRNAIYDLHSFDDFDEYKKAFYPASFIPFTMNDQVYALPQTLDMWVLFYRKDILDTIGVDIPETWDDMISILPTLYRYGMSVNTALSTGGALKSFTQMMPVIMQYGGKLYEDDGMHAAFSSPEFVEGFTFLTELYTKYSLSTSISNFYSSLRNGIAPIGVSAIQTYILLEKAASELDGSWGISLMPATKTSNGITRIHPAVMNGCYILSSTKRPDESWEFLKWWMSADNQTEYSVRLQSTYGEEYLWLTANRDALSECTLFAEADRDIVLKQLEELVEVPSHPASMLVQRALSDAWNKVVFNGEDVRSALDTAQLEADRGIEQKMRELGYVDENGTVIRALWQEEAK